MYIYNVHDSNKHKTVDISSRIDLKRHGTRQDKTDGGRALKEVRDVVEDQSRAIHSSLKGVGKCCV